MNKLNIDVGNILVLIYGELYVRIIYRDLIFIKVNTIKEYRGYEIGYEYNISCLDYGLYRNIIKLPKYL